MIPKLTRTKYIFDNSIESLVISFSETTGGYVDEVILPDDLMTQIFYQTDYAGKVVWIEIVDLDSFLQADETNDINIGEYNIKDLVKTELALNE